MQEAKIESFEELRKKVLKKSSLQAKVFTDLKTKSLSAKQINELYQKSLQIPTSKK